MSKIKNNKKRKVKQHASIANVEDKHKNKTKRDKDLFYFYNLTCSIANDDDMWLVDSCA